MLVGVENIQGPVARLDWGDGQTKNDVPTDIFSQGYKNPLARGREKPLKIFSQGRKNPAKNQTLR